MNKRGVEGYLENKENEKKLRELIIKYDKEVNLKSRITYKDIYEYIKLCNDNGDINFCPGITWWKTKGKSLIEEFNMIKMKKVHFSEKEQLDLVDMEDLIDKYGGDRKELTRYLRDIDIVLNRMVNRIKKLEKCLDESQTKISLQNQEINQKDGIIEKQKNLINNLFYLHVSNQYELKHVLEYEDGISELLRYSLEETFSNPGKFIKSFSELLISEKNKNDNIIELHSKTSQEDDFEF